MYQHNSQHPCTLDDSKHVQWTPSDKTPSVKVITTDGTITWQGTYCYGITGNIIHRQPDTMEVYIATLEKWEHKIIDNVEIL
eukprot:15365390-Ditylum_brightwellii.AAC.1